MAFVGVEIKNPPHVFSLIRINLNQPPAIDADIFIAVRSNIGEQPSLHAALDALADINGHLLGIKARHIGQHPPHHAASGCVFGGLGGVDDGHAMVGLKAFKLHVIKQIASGPIYLVKQHRINGLGVLPHIRQHVFEGFAFSFLTCGFCNTDQLDDGAAALLGPAFKGFHLHIQRKAFAFLLTARHTGKGYKAFRGSIAVSRNIFR